MDPKDYRKQVAREIEAASRHRETVQNFHDPSAPPMARQRALEAASQLDPADVVEATRIARDAKGDPGLRAAAIGKLAGALGKDPKLVDLFLALLADAKEGAPVRGAALGGLQRASFAVAAFDSRRAEYLTALRAAADAPDESLRERVLGVLSREKDGYAQNRLLDGLRDPTKALVPPEKALQLLAYDIKAEVFPLATTIAKAGGNSAARHEALRVLAADAGSRGMFETVLRDKKEPAEVRRIAATVLHAIDPAALVGHARAVVLDDGEPDELRATCLAALTSFGDAATMKADGELRAKIDQLRAAPTTSAATKRGAEAYFNKHR